MLVMIEREVINSNVIAPAESLTMPSRVIELPAVASAAALVNCRPVISIASARLSVEPPWAVHPVIRSLSGRLCTAQPVTLEATSEPLPAACE